MSLKAEPLSVLKHYWGYDSFRFEQEKIIQQILAGNDTLALMPTSAGKSICYQVPALCRNGLTLVITPLISLMIDQVGKLKSLGIAARAIHSPMTRREMEITINACYHSKVKLLYLSPERAVSAYFLNNVKDLPINLIAVDEAHCISKWGYDFRPSYMKIALLRQRLPNVPVLALTATATKEDVNVIQQELLFKKPNVISMSMKRDNLSYSVINQTDKLPPLKENIMHLQGCGIVYVRSRLNASVLAKKLCSEGINAKSYHAGMSIIDRNNVQSQWQSGQTPVVVATTAFGMGIDKPDVRWVAHYDLPESLDAYLQEAGRAGRDGKRAYAFLIYNQEDEYKLLKSVERNFPEQKLIRNIYNALGNQYAVACSTGEGRKFPFNMAEFCTKYNFDTYTTANALRILENSGLIALLPEGNPVSKVYISVSSDQLYDFLLQYPNYVQIIEALRRFYDGIFNDFVPINESYIAKKFHFADSDVCKSLVALEKLNILFYDRAYHYPMIEFTCARVVNSDFDLSNESYHQLKALTLKKAQEVIKYLHSTKCREQFLFDYFGQKTTQCQKCDICISKRQSSNNNTALKDIQNQIQAQLQEGEKSVDFFLSHLPNEQRDIFTKVLRSLIDKGIVSYNSKTNTLSLND